MLATLTPNSIHFGNPITVLCAGPSGSNTCARIRCSSSPAENGRTITPSAPDFDISVLSEVITGLSLSVTDSRTAGMPQTWYAIVCYRVRPTTWSADNTGYRPPAPQTLLVVIHECRIAQLCRLKGCHPRNNSNSGLRRLMPFRSGRAPRRDQGGSVHPRFSLVQNSTFLNCGPACADARAANKSRPPPREAWHSQPEPAVPRPPGRAAF
jgi:hypothetical protein